MNQTQKILSIMAIATLVAIGVYIFVFLQVRKASHETAEAEQMIQDELEKRDKQDSIRNLFIETEESRKELSTRVATKSSLVGFFEELEVLASEAEVEMSLSRIQENIELDQVIPKQAPDSKEKPKPRNHPSANYLEWMKMDIEASGTWEATYRFLTLIELIPYHIELSDIKFEQERLVNPAADGLEMSPGNWRLNFTIKMLQQKEE